MEANNSMNEESSRAKPNVVSLAAMRPSPAIDRDELRYALDEAYEQQREQEQAATLRKIRAHLPATLRSVSWSHLEKVADPPVPPEVLEELDQWCKQPDGNLVLLGDVGVGKTWAAIACLKRVVEFDQTFRFQPVSELFEIWNERGFSLMSVASTQWLVLDDLGSGRDLTDRERERLYTIINRRSLNGLHAIVTSNLDPEMLKNWVGIRTFDRLRQGKILLWPGRSRRS